MSRPKGGGSVKLPRTAFASEQVAALSLFGVILKWGIYCVVVLRNSVKSTVRKRACMQSAQESPHLSITPNEEGVTNRLDANAVPRYTA